MDETNKNTNNISFKFQKDESQFFYSNATSITAAFYDFQLIFSTQSVENEENKEGKIVTLKELCKIFMSPQHAKVLSQKLLSDIAKYEEHFGKIKIPSMLEELEK